MKRKFKIIFAIISLIINKLEAQNNRNQHIDSLMKSVANLGIFNGNVLVIEKGKTVYQSSFGYADASKKVKLDADYRFNIGSIAKEFNAVGIMMLKEQGKLNLEDKVSKYFPQLPTWADKISIKNLLQYTSGLPDINWKTIKNDDDIWNDLKKVEKLDFEPNTKYAYNNSNVFLQRRIIEKITGISFQKMVETKLLQPCGMKNSLIDPDLKGDKVAVSFNNNFVEDPRQFSYVMSGWTSVTANDLYKWLRCLHQFKIINQNSTQEILTPFAPSKQVGLGGGSMENGQFKEHFHHGSSFDFESLHSTLPSEGIYILLLTNNKNAKLFEIRDEILHILKKEPFKIPKKSLSKAIDGQLTKNNRNAEAMINIYQDLKVKSPNDYDFENESELNALGYSFMNNKLLDDAIKIFEFNVKLFPNSGNAFDSLGEAYYKKGDKMNALNNYKKAFSLDPANKGAKEFIDKLETEK